MNHKDKEEEKKPNAPNEQDPKREIPVDPNEEETSETADDDGGPNPPQPPPGKGH